MFIKIMLNLIIVIMSIIMFFIYHPMSMGICILFQTLMLCILSGMLINSYWFSYILFLTFLGGLLILFVYISSIASNEIFKFYISLNLIFYSIILSIILLFFFFSNNLIYMNINFNNEMNNLFNLMLFFNNENSINLTKLYNNQNYFLMMMMIIYLFITLIAVIKITNIFLGPLRSFIN